MTMAKDETKKPDDSLLKRDDKTPPEDRAARDAKIDKLAGESDWRNKQ